MNQKLFTFILCCILPLSGCSFFDLKSNDSNVFEKEEIKHKDEKKKKDNNEKPKKNQNQEESVEQKNEESKKQIQVEKPLDKPSKPTVDLQEKPEIKQPKLFDTSKLIEESGVARFVNDIPIVIHRDSPDGPEFGMMHKDEKQSYTHKYIGNGHRYIVWRHNEVLCFCAVTSQESSTSERWAVFNDEVDVNLQPDYTDEYTWNMDEVLNSVEKIHAKYGGHVGVYFKDLNSKKSIYYHNNSMYPCSIIKMCVMVTCYHYAELGKIDLETCMPYIRAMMIHSDNSSYNTLLSILGNGSGLQGAYNVNEYMQTLGLQNTKLHHGLRPGNGYFTDGANNVSCPTDIGILLEKIYMCQAASKDSCEEMLYLMAECADNRALRQGVPSNVMLSHKSGWAYDYYLDGGIVYGTNRNYILVVFTDGVQSKSGLFKEMSGYFYEYEQNIKE